MVGIVEAVRIDEIRVRTTQLLRPGIHHVRKLADTPRRMLGQTVGHLVGRF